MCFPRVVGLLLFALVCRQVAQANGVNPDDPVITLDGFCDDSSPHVDSCTTVITRAQFDKLVEALQPGMPVALRLKVANAYARNLKMSAAAHDRGLDKTPAFSEELRFARIQLLAQDLDNALRADANRVTEVDLAQYYEKNRPSFEQATVARLFVPHATQTGAGVDTMSQLALDLRSRARNGEDFDALQMAAYAQAGITKSGADTKLDNVRRSSLPVAHATVMDLMPGDVSEVFSDPAGGHFIYKIIAKEVLSLGAVKEEIRARIVDQRYRDSVERFQGGVIFSDAYFNPPSAPAQRSPRERKRSLVP